MQQAAHPISAIEGEMPIRWADAVSEPDGGYHSAGGTEQSALPADESIEDAPPRESALRLANQSSSDGGGGFKGVGVGGGEFSDDGESFLPPIPAGFSSWSKAKQLECMPEDLKRLNEM